MKNTIRKLLVMVVVICPVIAFVSSNIAISYEFDWEADYIGSKRCVACHKKYDIPHRGTGHGFLFMKMDDAGPNKGCEACHGPGSIHNDIEDEGTVFFGELTEDQANALCYNCHNPGSDMRSWEFSQHAMSDISCVKCHSPHNYKDTSLLAETEPELCYKCHGETRAEMSMPSHHPVKEGKVNCSDCHDVHNNSTLEVDRSAQKCIECHQEKAGPFMYDHPPVVESCTICHQPHGSVNQNLKVLNTPSLCLQCHAKTPITHVTAGNGRYNDCQTCHAALHGSNSNKEFFR